MPPRSLPLASVLPRRCWKDLGLPDSWTQFVTRVSSLASDATLRQTFRLDDQPAFLVNAIWAGGRVAVTWVTWVTTDGSRERHFLRWLSCK